MEPLVTGKRAANPHFTCWPLRTVAAFECCEKQLRARARPEAIAVPYHRGMDEMVSFSCQSDYDLIDETPGRTEQRNSFAD